MDDVPGCLECGACCFSNLATYVRVTGDDHARLGAAAEELVTFVGTRAYLRMVRGRCAALRVADGRFVCSVYDARPDICRNLARGSPECAGERFTKADRAAQSLVKRHC